MRRTITADLGALTEPFTAWCAAHRLSRSRALRQLVASLIGSKDQSSWLPPPSAGAEASDVDAPLPYGSASTCRFTLRLTPAERDRLRRLADRAGLTCNGYLIAMLTARASDAPAIAGKDAVQALTRSNDLLAQALSAIGKPGVLASSVGSPVRGGPASSPAIVDELREHLTRAATVLSLIEVSRSGAKLSKEPRPSAKASKRHRDREDPGDLG